MTATDAGIGGGACAWPWQRLRLVAAALMVWGLTACVSPPMEGEGGVVDLDVPAEPPPDATGAFGPALTPLARVPGVPVDAPRSRVPLVNYELAEGRTEEEAAQAPQDTEEVQGEVFQRGGASWYGIQFHQRLTANGERFDMDAMTAAHKSLPFNSRVCVRSLVNRREVLVRVNDRGPFVPSRVIDLSRAAAQAIGLIDLGIKQVTLTLVGPEGGRCAGVDVPALKDVAVPTVRETVAPARRSAAPRRGRAGAKKR